MFTMMSNQCKITVQSIGKEPSYFIGENNYITLFYPRPLPLNKTASLASSKDSLTTMIETYLVNNITCLAETIAKELRGQLLKDDSTTGK